ncbi:MAG TPA: hypothetical protein DCS07_07170 [Bdellovibrionales bacterium]|nr:MAG: hypothetical protein A2Z97_01070 [Bdellovibrionales bacterium GWB1_52_6]OFZ03602.1 MAG: hypothetical protein A2X97_00725 [Bdellovibrionales bacterium GWA1_52_35]OFZ34942.1 MAG: hypothetical protein A2070_14495 [Bdellovibrionales bacterium GWC1_52_8]HAR42400.1 hypothetical protein [Bdellovibrionales bacterium]HCM38913.1 hypothetical protein [Bdellovibrionales bacterium]
MDSEFKKEFIVKTSLLYKTFIALGLIAGVTTTTLMISSCGKGVLGGTTAQLSFNDATITASMFDLLKTFKLFPEALAAPATPVYFGIKFLAAYLAEDVDPITQNNAGQVAKIYVNPECPDNPGCSSSEAVTTFFDFARTSTEVNAELNGQKRIIKPGTYKYVRLDFCIGGGTRNVAFRETAGSELVYANSNNCGRTSQPMTPPLAITEGDQVIINLNYTLTDLVVDSPGGDVSPISGTRSVSFPDFIPTAKKL